MKGLRAEILRSRYYSPGVSDDPTVKASQVTIVTFDGAPLPEHMQVFEESADAPAVAIDHNTPNHMRARALWAGRASWRMASGAWIHSGDSRFHELTGTSYPIPLHDRAEH